MNTISKPMSLWDDTSTETIRIRNDDLNDAIDVAIVGAGFTGLSAAIHCTEKGMVGQAGILVWLTRLHGYHRKMS